MKLGKGKRSAGNFFMKLGNGLGDCAGGWIYPGLIDRAGLGKGMLDYIMNYVARLYETVPGWVGLEKTKQAI